MFSGTAIRRKGSQVLPLFTGIHIDYNTFHQGIGARVQKSENGFSEVESYARRLDMFYIPTRYPDGLAGELAPAEFYELEDAEQCISYAELILESVKRFSKR